MDLTKLPGYQEAAKLSHEAQSPRAHYMAHLESYVAGTQYDHLQDWFSQAPIWERAPCVVDPIIAAGIASNCDMVLGEGRWPSLTSNPGEDDSDFDGESGLDEDDSATLDRFNAECQKQSRFRAAVREVFSSAQGCGSGVLIQGTRKQRLFCDTTRARWCDPELDSDGTCNRLVIEYPYVEPYRDRYGKWRIRARMFRREIDAKSDTTFISAELGQDSKITWKPDPEQTFEHGLGFCPVVWYPFMRGADVAARIDGRAIHAQLLDEIRAYDYANSQEHRAALYAGDPQWTEIGVDMGYNPAPGGAVMDAPATPKGGQPTSPSGNNAIHAHYVGAPSKKKGRRKGVGDVWQYEAPDVKVEMHTLPADALGALSKDAEKIRRIINHAMAVIDLDPESIKFAATTSGAALEAIKQRQLDRCDQYRDDVADRLLLPATDQQMRIVATMGTGLKIRGLGKALPILARFNKADVAVA